MAGAGLFRWFVGIIIYPQTRPYRNKLLIRFLLDNFDLFSSDRLSIISSFFVLLQIHINDETYDIA